MAAWRSALAVLLGLAALVPAAAGSGAPGAVPAPWGVVTTLNHGARLSVSCPTADTCWAIGGGELLYSATAGAAWTPRTSTLPAAADSLDSLDCPTDQVCFVGLRAADGTPKVATIRAEGVALVEVPLAGPVVDLDCSSAVRCLAIDADNAAVTVDGGATWTRRAAPLPAGVGSVSCAPGTDQCTGVGVDGGTITIARTSNSGGSWQLQDVPPGRYVAVDCRSVQVCYAVGSGGLNAAIAATFDAGATWSRQPLPNTPGALGSVSCPTTTTCTAFGHDDRGPIALGTSDGGAHWAALVLPQIRIPPNSYSSNGYPPVSCPTAKLCAAVTGDGGAFATTDAGVTWRLAAIPTGLGSARLSCPLRLRCIGLGFDAIHTLESVISVDGGVSFTRGQLPPAAGSDSVSALDCATASSCQAWATKDGHGQSLATSDGGVTWTVHRGSDVAPLNQADLACADELRCLAVDTTPSGKRLVRATTDGGQTWLSRPVPTGARGLSGVACDPTSCVLIGSISGASRAWVTDDLGATYGARPLPVAGFGYEAVDCSGDSCVAVGNDPDSSATVAYSLDHGASWSPASLPAGDYDLYQVSCGPPGLCAVSGYRGPAGQDGSLILGTRDGGHTWRILDTPPGTSTVPDVACPPVGRRCLATAYSVNGLLRVIAGQV